MKKSSKAAICCLMAAGMIFTPAAAAKEGPPNQQAAQAFDNKIVKKIDKERIYQHVYNLSVDIGIRVAGTEGEMAAVHYIADQYRSMGLDVEIQPFEFQTYQSPTKVSLGVTNSELTFAPRAFSYSPATPSEGVSGEIVDAGLGSSSDFEQVDAEGKIALIERGTYTFVEKVENAAAAGAIAVVMYNNTSGPLASSLNPSGTFVPTVGLTREEGLSIKSLLNQGQSVETNVQIVGGGVVTKTSHNVIATKKAHKNHDTGQIIYVGSHHDSVPGAPGASDNASGVGVNLEIARAVSNMQTDTEIRFLTFGAEELGLLGSYHYVSTLTEDEKDRSVGMFNFDMVGNKNSGDMIMFTVDGQRNVITDTAASASIRVSKPLTYGKVGRSDHQPFHDAGIPAAVYSYAPLEPQYHQPTDTIEHISKERMENIARIVGASVYQIARKDTPALEKSRVAPQPVEPEFENRPL
ncbi:M28 family peptidase [Siminovitchia sediminis]|uniref:M28 family peptidase n=1 Tax=Siminovitchia sediminis TaxID=1274353 RepID=A0ABW4KM10_9BACI